MQSARLLGKSVGQTIRLAPGEGVLVADKWNPGSGKPADGTSFAAPHVAGVIAQFLEYDQADPAHPLMNAPWILMDAVNSYTTTYGIVQGITGAASGTPNKSCGHFLGAYLLAKTTR